MNCPQETVADWRGRFLESDEGVKLVPAAAVRVLNAGSGGRPIYRELCASAGR